MAAEAHERRILLTGATTALGRAILTIASGDPRVRKLLGVYGPDDFEPSPTESPRVAYMRADIARYREARRVLFGEQARDVDTVVHTPLHAGMGEARERAFLRHVEATRHLLALAEERRSIRRFVFVGFAGVYRIDGREPLLIDEDHALDLSSDAPQAVRSRVEADLTVSAKIASSRVEIVVLRCAAILAPGTGSQLYDYLSSRVCLRPLGYDPMVNVLSLRDAARAVHLAAMGECRGIFNIPGRDTLPLSELLHRAGRLQLAVPGPALGPLYRARALLTRRQFRYGMYRPIFHLGAILDGRKARETFGYLPEHPVAFDVELGAV